MQFHLTCVNLFILLNHILLEVISYGTTITRHISSQSDYLSFPRNALVEVYAKNDDLDVWLVKVTIVSLHV